jgi:hypothetical protein
MVKHALGPEEYMLADDKDHCALGASPMDIPFEAVPGGAGERDRLLTQFYSV